MAERTECRDLELACRIADALIACGTPEAAAIVDELAWPTATFVGGARVPKIANAAWRALGASTALLEPFLDEAADTGAVVRVPELALGAAHVEAIVRPAGTHVTVACRPIEAGRSFLAVVLHELQAPLSAIAVWERVLRDETADPALRARAIDAIGQSVRTQARLVADLLDVSRGLAGTLHVDRRPVAIGRVVRDAVAAFAPVAAEKQIVLEHRDDAPGAEVEGDVIRIRQVLDNLIANALSFTESGGRIDVTVSPRAHAVDIEVRDSGQGMAPALLTRLFDPTRQWERITTRPEGIGLGLAIVQQLVRRHGGTVVASSAGAGQGTTLTVTLPLLGA